jgi:CheY-like chemotaxis protein
MALAIRRAFRCTSRRAFSSSTTNETNRDILRTRLGRHGYELMEAADGEEAMAAARQHHPDLILLDVMMPKVDGVEACRQLKADANLPFMPIILVTAKADTKDVVAGLEAGADEHRSHQRPAHSDRVPLGHDNTSANATSTTRRNCKFVSDNTLIE